VAADVAGEKARGEFLEEGPHGRDGDADDAEGAFDDGHVEGGDEIVCTCVSGEHVWREIKREGEVTSYVEALDVAEKDDADDAGGEGAVGVSVMVLCSGG
jgi:hypothetical protein